MVGKAAMTETRMMVVVVMAVAMMAGAGVEAVPSPNLMMWPSSTHYIDYLVAKNCLGEDAALELERQGMAAGRECWMKEWESSFGVTSGQDAGRVKRNILKMPTPASSSLLVCNLRALNVLTPQFEMNYPVVNNWIDANVTDAVVRERLLRLSSECQPPAFPPPRPLITPPPGHTEAGAGAGTAGAGAGTGAESLMKGVRDFHVYMACMNAGGTKICMEREMERVSAKWNNLNNP